MITNSVLGGMLNFNPSPSFIMHLDLNSCFASIEQQANPFLRGKAVAVAAYTTPGGCIIAPSVEAKRLGIKVGMRVRDGKALYPSLIILSPDPWKYRNVHWALRKIISDYSNDFSPKSIDEFVLDLSDYLSISRALKVAPYGVALEIKKRIRREIGEWLTVSVGIAPNRYLAKVAASLHKPDGLDEINKNNCLDIYSKLELTDLPWIKSRNALRLNSMGIFSVLDFYKASYLQLRGAFKSALAYYWFLRLRGWEIDNVESPRRSYGNAYALSKPLTNLDELAPILSKLVEKTSFRLRNASLVARGVEVAVFYRNGYFWHKAKKTSREVFLAFDIYKKALSILSLSPKDLAVRELAVSCYDLCKARFSQLCIFEDTLKKKAISEAIDKINHRFGNFVIASARVFSTDREAVSDRIAFGQPAELTPQALLAGGVKELEEFVNS
jgi:DNA polymerase-4